MIGAGAMDQPILIERRVVQSDGAGGHTEYWERAWGVWANVRAMAAAEGMEAGRMNATYLVAFTIYTIADLDEANYRIRWNDETYNIRAVMRSGNPMTVQVRAERGVAS